MSESTESIQDNSSEQKTKHWLQRLKDESWEAELLISAIAIFGTFQLFKVIEWAVNVCIDRLPSEQFMIGYAITYVGLLGVSVLVSMFVIHFFLRAYWVGLVGLNSVYPDYGLEDSAYSKIYTERILGILPSLKDSIEKVDQLCSVIFSSAFSVMLIYGYMAIIAALYLTLFNLLDDYVPKIILLIPAYIVGAVLLFQGLLGIVANLKKFKENFKVQNLYFKTVKFASIIGFGPLYKNILQITMTFGSNFKKNKALVGLLMLFFVSGMVLSIVQFDQTNIPYLIRQNAYFDKSKTYAGFYTNRNQEMNFLITPEIGSDLIESSTTSIFIPIFNKETSNRNDFCENLNDDEELSREESLAQYLQCYTAYNQVFLNNVHMPIDFLKYDHSRTKQFGLKGHLDLSSASKGNNTITVKKMMGTEVYSQWTIPFYYAPKSE